MRTLALCGVLFLVSCGDGGGMPATGRGGSTGTGGTGGVDYTSKILGNWILQNGTRAAFADFNSDSTYAAGALEVTGTTTANVQLEGGQFVAGSAAITFLPTKSSCGSSDPPYSVDYGATASSLTFTDPTGAVVFARNSASATTSAVLTYGCFDQNGVFVAMPLVPVN